MTTYLTYMPKFTPIKYNRNIAYLRHVPKGRTTCLIMPTPQIFFTISFVLSNTNNIFEKTLLIP
jgi:hypothetical protein